MIFAHISYNLLELKEKRALRRVAIEEVDSRDWMANSTIRLADCTEFHTPINEVQQVFREHTGEPSKRLLALELIVWLRILG